MRDLLDLQLSVCVQRKSNRNQLCWLVHKVRLSGVAEAAGCKSFQQFLDTRQYSRHSIRSYELIFGKNFCCPGGLESTEVMHGCSCRLWPEQCYFSCDFLVIVTVKVIIFQVFQLQF